MQRFADAFVRNADGSWFCRATVDFIAPNGERASVTPGVTYRPGKLVMGFDIATWLDDWADHRKAPAGVSFEPRREP
jgi:hypothetical protein